MSFRSGRPGKHEWATVTQKWLPCVYRVMKMAFLECLEGLGSSCTRGSPWCVLRDKRPDKYMFPILISRGPSADTLPQRNRTKEGTYCGKNWCDDKTNWEENAKCAVKKNNASWDRRNLKQFSNVLSLFSLFCILAFFIVCNSKMHITGFVCLLICFSRGWTFRQGGILHSYQG